VIVDTTKPTVTTSAPTGTAQLTRHQFRFDFSEPVSGLTLADFSVSGSATGCTLSYTANQTRALVTASGCSNGTVAVTLSQDSVADDVGNLGPAAIITTSAITQITIAPTPTPIIATLPELPTLMAISPDRFIGPLTANSRAALVLAGVVQAPAGLAGISVAADLTALASPTAPANMVKSISLNTGDTLDASLMVDASLIATHDVVGYLQTSTGWINLGTTDIDPNGVITVPAVFTDPGSFFMRIIVKQKTVSAQLFSTQNFSTQTFSTQTFSTQSLTDDYVMGLGEQSLEITITVAGAAIPLQQPATSSPSYSGPMVDNSPQTISTLGGQVGFTGKMLSGVSKVEMGSEKLKLEVVRNTDKLLVLKIPAVSAGVYSISFTTSFGKLIIQDSLIVKLASNPDLTGSRFFTKRISETQIKVYAKNIIEIGKVQFIVNGRELAWVRAANQLVPKLRGVQKNNQTSYYLVRTIELDKRQRIEIRVNDQRVRFVTYNPSK
jgi:hypothetical protein